MRKKGLEQQVKSLTLKRNWSFFRSKKVGRWRSGFFVFGKKGRRGIGLLRFARNDGRRGEWRK